MDKIKDIIFLAVFLAVAAAGVMSFMAYVKDIDSEPRVGQDADGEKEGKEVSFNGSDDGLVTTTLFIKDIEVEALVADTPESLRQGLSGRMFLPEGTAMLFVFDEPTRAGIWMKDMLFSIDILWIDETYRVIHVVLSASPESFPKIFRPEHPAKYVLETHAGFVAENGIVLGDIVVF